MEKILPKPNPQTCRGSTSGQADSRVRTFLYLADSEGLQASEALSFLKSLDSSKARLPKIDPNGASGPQDGEADHVGIVEKCENGIVYTIEGNSGDACRQNQYPVGYYEILGYGILNP